LQGEWSDETHTIISELLEVLFKKNIINGDDLIQILNMYHSKSVEKEVQG
jgi:chorismate mutase